MIEKIFLDFEKPIVQLEKKIDMLRSSDFSNKYRKSERNLKIKKLEERVIRLTKEIFSNLNDWQIVKLSRHPMRPHTYDYIHRIFTDFQELSGDRLYREDKAIVGGIARIDGRSIVVIGHQKGRDIEEMIERNFGMSSPEGYRKSLRLMKIAENFRLPIITLIDTPGAYPGVEAEERGQSIAIANNLRDMSNLFVPIICTVIGEGGSGGALAIGVGDRINMFEYSTYSVISPEGCSAILWKESKKANLASEMMGITSRRLKSLGLIDNIIEEPLGGAHRNYSIAANNLKRRILSDLKILDGLSEEELVYQRYQKLMRYGKS
ncbi:acetyl-CoA carboxylase carboxyl transferase subunit alpha [Candidatus Riesia pediculicola]|uniref:Acetyl-coenzyme A carboxylase carboxyl transferase subunit alpha n=1 Tax=Riesia pediculicola (strain USDA) TaxID=515618 RepID=D4G8D7_RIEPU|nr:acetyl-CoA carboxylase, carboxyl transferase, alpha subunit [Candidatus Riesia pediculicola USDA]